MREGARCRREAEEDGEREQRLIVYTAINTAPRVNYTMCTPSILCMLAYGAYR